MLVCFSSCEVSHLRLELILAAKTAANATIGETFVVKVLGGVLRGWLLTFLNFWQYGTP